MDISSMHRSTFFGVACGLFTLVASPTIALGQCGEASQLSYWEYDPETATLVELQTSTRLVRFDLCFDALDPEGQKLLDENGGGFVNVVFRTDESMPWEWVVQNAYESVPDQMWLELGNLAYEFGLNTWENGVVIEVGEFGVTVLEDPAADMPGVSEILVLPILPRDRVIPPPPLGDVPLVPDDFAPRIDWEHAGHWIGPGERPLDRARTKIAPKNIPPVYRLGHEDVPAAHARSIGYLSALYGFRLHPTWDSQNQQDLFHSYLQEMGTFEQGTPMDGARVGRRAENDQRNLPIREGDSDWIPGREPGQTDEEDLTFEEAIAEAMDRLRHGHDVEFTFTGRVGQSMAHPLGLIIHRMMIVGIDKVQSSSDPTQTIYRIKFIGGSDSIAGVTLNVVMQVFFNSEGEICNPDGSEYVPGLLLPSGKIVQFHWDEFIPRLCDMNNDGVVNGADLAHFCGKWGMTPDGSEADGDFNGDGHINGLDLAILLGVWDWRFFVFGL